VHIWDDDAYRYYLELMKKNNNTVLESNCLPPDKWKMNITEKEPLTKEEFIEEVKKGSKIWIVTSPLVGIMSYYPNEYCFEYTFGDLGSVYGKQWRNWYGVDQIKKVIETLRTNPDDRRMIVSAWNVKELDKMALPPCHYSFQFYTRKMDIVERRNWADEHNFDCWDEKSLDKNNVPSRKLSCMFHIRSNDVGCGTSFNWASYAILTHMVAQCCNMEVDELIYDVGDAHIYENHIEQLHEQLKRNPHKYALPKLELNPNVKEIDDFRSYDIKIVGYKSYPAIKLPLNVGL
jgi:thymidylate synthase